MFTGKFNTNLVFFIQIVNRERQGKRPVLIDMMPGGDKVIGLGCINTPPDTKKLKYHWIKIIYNPHIFVNLDKCVLLHVVYTGGESKGC